MIDEKKHTAFDMGKTQETTSNKYYPQYSLEDGIYIPMKNSREGLLIKSAHDGKINHVRKYLESGVGKRAILDAVDAALKNNNWEIATAISDYCHVNDFDCYSECLKKQFLKASYNEDIEKVKFYLQQLIVNIVGELTDETGKSTLEIALEGNPADLTLILSNYGFNEQSLRYAYKCLSVR